MQLWSEQPCARPVSAAHRRSGELQTIRAGVIAGLTEWKNRKNSGMLDAVAQSLSDVTISHFNSSSKRSTKPSHRQSTMFQACSTQPCAGLSGAGGSGHAEAEGVFGF